MANPEPQDLKENQHGHETTDAEVRPIVVYMAGLALLVFLSMLAMAWLLDVLQYSEESARGVPKGLTDTAQIPPMPRLQAYPADDLQRLRASEEEQLGTYGWVDEATGIMRIPIDRAMDILAENGLPARQATEQGGSEGAQ